jgi:hypothetical protein
MSEAFVKTLKRDYIRNSPLPDAPTPRSGRSMDGSRTPTKSIFIRAQDGFPSAVHPGKIKLADCPVKGGHSSSAAAILYFRGSWWFPRQVYCIRLYLDGQPTWGHLHQHRSRIKLVAPKKRGSGSVRSSPAVHYRPSRQSSRQLGRLFGRRTSSGLTPKCSYSAPGTNSRWSAGSSLP